MSLKDKIFAADDVTRDLESVPEWGITIELRSPTGAERAQLMNQTVDENGDANKAMWPLLWPYALICCAHDPDTGERIFDWDDVNDLQTKSASVLTRLGDKCLNIAGLKPDAVEDAKKSTDPES